MGLCLIISRYYRFMLWTSVLFISNLFLCSKYYESHPMIPSYCCYGEDASQKRKKYFGHLGGQLNKLI